MSRWPRLIAAVILVAAASLLAPAAAWAQTPVTVVVTSSPASPSVFGQAVTFTATVTGPGGGPASGSVTFFDASPGGGTLGTVALNSAGQASVTTSSLPVGTRTILADYTPTGLFDFGIGVIVFNVNLANTTTTVVSSQNPSVSGQSVTFTATVTANAPSTATPTGTVTFRNATTNTFLGTVTLNGSGQASLATSALAIGAHSIEASYTPSSAPNFNLSSNSLTQTVNQAATSTALTSSQNPSNLGQAVTFTATVTASAPGSGTPTGTVTFKDGATTLGTGTLAGGTATFATSSLTAGSHSITATYDGDTKFTASTSPTLTQSVNQAGTGTALTSSQNPSSVGQAVTFTATVTGSGGTPTGTVTFKDGATTLGTVALASGTAAFTTSSLTTGAHSITATYNGDSNFTASTSPTLTQTVNQAATTTALVSSKNPSSFGETVTFTATVTGSGGTPTGTVTFKDGATVIGTATLNGAGVATFATASLTVGSHSITATYSGDTNFVTSTSAVVLQAVAVPADSLKLRALQIAVTKIQAQGAGQLISSAIDAAIADGFADGNTAFITGSENGLRFNFAADGPQTGEVKKRVGDAFDALAALPPAMPLKTPYRPSRDWLVWAEVRGTGWDVTAPNVDIRGGQTAALLGLTRKLSPDVLVGLFGGYENFSYTSQLLNGRLKGDGWTVGGYFGWRPMPGLRLDAGVARSSIAYDGLAGTAAGQFAGQRWLVTGGITGTYKMTNGLELEPSARIYMLWEQEDAYVDSLGIQQAARSFSTGRASVGAKASYPWLMSADARISPYVGVYADYYFTKDDAAALVAPNLLPTEFVHGLSARVTSGLAIALANGLRFSVGGELGGIGSDFKVWTARGRAAIPLY